MQPRSIYLSNLAVADLVLVSCLPFWAVNLYNDYHWPFGLFMCKVVNLGIKINAYCSIYFLVLVSIDRYIALVHAMSHGRMRRPKYAKLGCLLVWIFGLFLGSPVIIFRKVEYIAEYDVIDHWKKHLHLYKDNFQMKMNGYSWQFQSNGSRILSQLVPLSRSPVGQNITVGLKWDRLYTILCFSDLVHGYPVVSRSCRLCLKRKCLFICTTFSRKPVES